MLMDKCDECNGKMQKKKVPYVLLGINLGNFDALICNSCSQTLYGGETLTEVEAAAKEKGIWGLAAKTTIGTSGNALDVKLPKAIIEFMKIKKGQEVIIEPIDQKRLQVILG